MSQKFIVDKVSSSTSHEKYGRILTFDDFKFEEEFTLEQYGMFGTIEEARQCLEEHKSFWYRCYKAIGGYECHVEYVRILEVEWDDDENEIAELRDFWDTSFENFEVK